LFLMPMAALATSVTSITANIPLTYYGAESLSLSTTVSTGTSVAFPQTGGTSSSVISINTNYTLAPGRVLTVEAGFSTTGALFNGFGNYIPTNAVSGAFTSSAGAVTNQTNCASTGSGVTAISSGLSCGWISYPAITSSNTSGNHTDTLTLSLVPTGAVPGSYTGTLLISAQAN
jgi:hypothetical protein